MSMKLQRITLIVVLMFALASAMPHEPRIPANIPASDIVLADASLNQELSVLVTRSEINVYRL
jgi:hypothetical protein